MPAARPLRLIGVATGVSRAPGAAVDAVHVGHDRRPADGQLAEVLPTVPAGSPVIDTHRGTIAPMSRPFGPAALGGRARAEREVTDAAR